MTDTQMIDTLTKLYKEVDKLAPYNVDEKRVYLLDYIQSQLFGIATGKKPTRSQFAEMLDFIKKYYQKYDNTGSDTWHYVYSIFDNNYTIIIPAMVLNAQATFGIPDDIKAPIEKYGKTTEKVKSIFAYADKLAENGVNTLSVSYDDVLKHLKLNGKSVKATKEKPFYLGGMLVNSFYMDSIFRMLKAEKLEFIINEYKPIVIKDAGVIVGVVCPIIKR